MDQKKQTIKQRILEVIDYKGYSYTHFFSLLKNTSYNNFKGEKLYASGINSESIIEILAIFPEINPEWLLIGKGEMLKYNIGDRFRLLIKEFNMDVDYIKKYLDIDSEFISSTDFLNIHKLYLLTKLLPKLSQKWILTGEGKMHDVKGRSSKKLEFVNEDVSRYDRKKPSVIDDRNTFDEVPTYNYVKGYSRRIQQLLDYLMLTPATFSKNCGFSNNMIVQLWLDGKYEPKPESYNKILNRYPAINRNWLFFGEGSMWIRSDYFKEKFDNICESDKSNNKKRTAGEIINILFDLFECNKADLSKRIGISTVTISKYMNESANDDFSRKIVSTIHRNIGFIPMDWLNG